MQLQCSHSLPSNGVSRQSVHNNEVELFWLIEVGSCIVLKPELKTTDFVPLLHTARTYTRILQDIRMVLIHPWAVAELLTCHMAILLEAVSLVDRFQEYERKLGSHAEWGNDAWLKPVQFEVTLFLAHLCSHLHNTVLQHKSCHIGHRLSCTLACIVCT